METKNQQNNFNNPVVIILVLALIGLGGYVIFSKNSSNNVENKITDSLSVPQTQETQIVPTQPANTVKPKAEPSQLTAKQTECKNFLLPFTLLAMNDLEKAQANARLNDPQGTVSYMKSKDPVIGYSPSLGKCVGGYYIDNYSITNNYESLHSWVGVVVSLSSDWKSEEVIASYNDNSNIMGLAKQYEGKLYELTNGEIGKIKW